MDKTLDLENLYADDHAEQYLLEVWRDTGLFSSVEVTGSRIPTLSGVFIIRDCSLTQENRYLSQIATLFTLGLFPTYIAQHETCVQQLYQNGKLVVNSNFSFDFLAKRGFLVSPVNDKTALKKSVQMFANNLLSKIGN